MDSTIAMMPVLTCWQIFDESLKFFSGLVNSLSLISGQIMEPSQWGI